jgi:hypothetical protein
MKLFDIFGFISIVVVVCWGMWKIIFKDFPVTKPNRRSEGEKLKLIVTTTVAGMRESIVEGEKQKARLEKLLRLAQQSHDAKMMHETLMMYSEHVEALKSDRERLQYFEELYVTIDEEKP